MGSAGGSCLSMSRRSKRPGPRSRRQQSRDEKKGLSLKGGFDGQSFGRMLAGIYLDGTEIRFSPWPYLIDPPRVEVRFRSLPVPGSPAVPLPRTDNCGRVFFSSFCKQPRPQDVRRECSLATSSWRQSSRRRRDESKKLLADFTRSPAFQALVGHHPMQAIGVEQPVVPKVLGD
jgi:hypothetical protein